LSSFCIKFFSFFFHDLTETGSFQQWENNQLIDVVEPHITVKAQGGLTADKNWIREVKKVCQGFPTFKVSLNEPKFFGDSVVFLSVDSEKIYELHQKIVKAIPLFTILSF
jgi:hypothetical protein